MLYDIVCRRMILLILSRMEILYNSGVEQGGLHVAERGQQPRVTPRRAVDTLLGLEDDLHRSADVGKLLGEYFSDFLVGFDIVGLTSLESISISLKIFIKYVSRT